jgi:hypothetical protein
MIGVNMADLKSDGTLPFFRDKFIIFVIGSMRMSMFCLKMLVGIGSKLHDLAFEDIIIFFTFSSDTGLNSDKHWPKKGTMAQEEIIFKVSMIQLE